MNGQRLKKALKKAWQRNEDERWIYGLMGKIKDGVPVFDVEGRAGYVYVRVRNQNGAQTSPPARNDPGVAHSAGLGVRMRMEGTTLVIDSEVRREDLATTPAPPGSGVGTHIHDTRYFTEAEHINVSAGAGDAGKPIVLNASGEVDATMLPSTVLTDTDDLPEGSTNLYYTDERAQDAVGLMIDDTATVALAYVDATPSLTATVIDGSITYAKMQDVSATDRFLGRDTAGAGDVEEITPAAARTMLNVADGANNYVHPNHTGDVTSVADGATTIGANKVLTAMIADAQVTLAKMANLAADTMIGRANGAGTGVPQALTATQVIAILQAGLDARYGQLAATNTWTLLQTFSSGIVSATVDGSTAANGDLTLQGTTNATRTTSYVILQPTAGNVGIGESTPIEKLHVAGNIIVPNGSFFKGMMLDATPIRVFGLGADDIAYFGGIDAGVTEVRFRTAGLNRLTIDASGDVGIGTITPSAALHVAQPTLGDPVYRLQSAATNDDPSEIVYQARVATTNATVTTLHTFTIPASTTYVIEVDVVGRRTGGAAGAAEDSHFRKFVATYKNVAGTATQMGFTNVATHSEGGWGGVTLSPTGATTRVQVEGLASVNITWHGTFRVWQVST